MNREERAWFKDANINALRKAGVPFSLHNEGRHVRIEVWPNMRISYWPTTDLWIVDGSRKRHCGVYKLIEVVTRDGSKHVKADKAKPHLYRKHGVWQVRHPVERGSTSVESKLYVQAVDWAQRRNKKENCVHFPKYFV